MRRPDGITVHRGGGVSVAATATAPESKAVQGLRKQTLEFLGLKAGAFGLKPQAREKQGQSAVFDDSLIQAATYSSSGTRAGGGALLQCRRSGEEARDVLTDRCASALLPAGGEKDWRAD